MRHYVPGRSSKRARSRVTLTRGAALSRRARMAPKLTMTRDMNRRDLLLRGLTTAAAFGLGATRWTAFGQVLTPAPLDITKNVCTLTCSATLGPCYYAANLIRRDITEGEAGLPTLLSFLIVDADTCAPIEHASLEIWHTNAKG